MSQSGPNDAVYVRALIKKSFLLYKVSDFLYVASLAFVFFSLFFYLANKVRARLLVRKTAICRYMRGSAGERKVVKKWTRIKWNKIDTAAESCESFSAIGTPLDHGKCCRLRRGSHHLATNDSISSGGKLSLHRMKVDFIFME